MGPALGLAPQVVRRPLSLIAFLARPAAGSIPTMRTHITYSPGFCKRLSAKIDPASSLALGPRRQTSGESARARPALDKARGGRL
jgi:hypothetical protein